MMCEPCPLCLPYAPNTVGAGGSRGTLPLPRRCSLLGQRPQVLARSLPGRQFAGCGRRPGRQSGGILPATGSLSPLCDPQSHRHSCPGPSQVAFASTATQQQKWGVEGAAWAVWHHRRGGECPGSGVGPAGHGAGVQTQGLHCETHPSTSHKFKPIRGFPKHSFPRSLAVSTA